MLRYAPRSGRALLIAAAIAGCSIIPAAAQGQHRTNLLDLKLGTQAGALPEEAFIDFACGTNGGPPGRLIGSFLDFAECPPEASGLHEVTFRYDDELEYMFLARGNASGAEMNGGTTLGEYSIHASALFDAKGILRGLRAVTDDRETLRNRSYAYLLADYAKTIFGKDGFACTEQEPTHGQEPLAGTFINETCSKTGDGLLIHTEAHLFRKAGQTEVNSRTGQLNRGQFESSARLEIREAGVALDASGRPL